MWSSGGRGSYPSFPKALQAAGLQPALAWFIMASRRTVLATDSRNHWPSSV